MSTKKVVVKSKANKTKPAEKKDNEKLVTKSQAIAEAKKTGVKVAAVGQKLIKDNDKGKQQTGKQIVKSGGALVKAATKAEVKQATNEVKRILKPTQKVAEVKKIVFPSKKPAAKKTPAKIAAKPVKPTVPPITKIRKSLADKAKALAE